MSQVRPPSARQPKGDDKGDDKRIQGTWKVTSAEVGAKAVKDKEPIGNTITFDGNKYTIRPTKRNASDSGTFKLTPDKKPKQIDMTAAGFDKPTLGLYELDGDTLKIGIGDLPEEERPVKLATQPERKKLFLLVLKRVKK